MTSPLFVNGIPLANSYAIGPGANIHNVQGTSRHITMT